MIDNPEDRYEPPRKRDLRGILDLNPRFCKICGKRLHAKQDIVCSRHCLARYRSLKHERKM